MPTEVIFPKVDMDMAEGKIAKWHVRDGQSVTKGEPIFEIETDKAAMEIEAPVSGVIQGISVSEGDVAQVGAAVAWIYAMGETPVEAVKAAPQAAAAPPVHTEALVPSEILLPQTQPDFSGGGGKVAATPLARRLAREKGIDLKRVAGTGPRGRVQSEDVTARAIALPSPMPSAQSTRDGLPHLHLIRKGDLSQPLPCSSMASAPSSRSGRPRLPRSIHACRWRSLICPPMANLRWAASRASRTSSSPWRRRLIAPASAPATSSAIPSAA